MVLNSVLSAILNNFNKSVMERALGGSHGAFKVRTQVTHAAPKPLAIASRQGSILKRFNDTEKS
ncbi:hypothetical protein LYNGBM3L_67830 [Moorena producens 3L]|uniref:Uncharacterized protein n=1 Tax=Moorena producens 3L TaxID=489825 RepID=F4Y1E0_9CYAN|nr:hypothetical protein LYNGBM3L_67830 [Moorena producens 3L]OLT64084.1 hypothetical protein BI334_02720 [Moorena producens 3L]